MQQRVSREGRQGEAVPTADPEVALVLFDEDTYPVEVPIAELTFRPKGPDDNIMAIYGY